MTYGPTKPILVSAAQDSTIRFWDVNTQKQLEMVLHKESQINEMCITPDGQQLAVVGWNHLRMFDLNELTPNGLHTFNVHDKNVTAVGFQAAGEWMYTAGEDGYTKIWDMRVNQLNCQRMFEVRNPVHCVTLHPNQMELVVSDSTGAIYIWDLRADRDDSLLTEVDLTEYVVHVDIDRSGTQCAAVTNRGHLFLWQIQHGLMTPKSASPTTIPQLSPLGTAPLAPPELSPLPNSSNLLQENNNHMLPSQIDPTLAQQQFIATQEVSGLPGWHSPVPMMPSPHPPLPIHPQFPQTMLSRMVPRAKFSAHNTFALKCRFTPDGFNVATTSADQTTKLWSVMNEKLLHTYCVPGNKWIWDCAFTNDSRFMINASSDAFLRMWEIQTGKVVRQYQGHSMAITAMAFYDLR